MTRLEFHKKLASLLGSKFVYFQPPANYRIHYPCFIYHQAPFDITAADNHGYIVTDHYIVTHISKDPETIVPKEFARWPMVTHSESYVTDNLYHEVFSIYV